MKPCKHGNHPFSYCKECGREMNKQIGKEQLKCPTCGHDVKYGYIVPVNRNDVLNEAIEAINNVPFDMSTDEYLYKREHQEQGIIKAVNAVKALITITAV